MDGRVQEPIIQFIKQRFNVSYVDCITEAGPNGILSNQTVQTVVASILNRIDISIDKHNSQGIAIVGHFDCAGNPGDRKFQDQHTSNAINFLKEKYPDQKVIGLYVDDEWSVVEI
jgi:uncharacterized protein YlxP (DUF503 family)